VLRARSFSTLETTNARLVTGTPATRVSTSPSCTPIPSADTPANCKPDGRTPLRSTNRVAGGAATLERRSIVSAATRNARGFGAGFFVFLVTGERRVAVFETEGSVSLDATSLACDRRSPARTAPSTATQSTSGSGSTTGANVAPIARPSTHAQGSASRFNQSNKDASPAPPHNTRLPSTTRRRVSIAFRGVRFGTR